MKKKKENLIKSYELTDSGLDLLEANQEKLINTRKTHVYAMLAIGYTSNITILLLINEFDSNKNVLMADIKSILILLLSSAFYYTQSELFFALRDYAIDLKQKYVFEDIFSGLSIAAAVLFYLSYFLTFLLLGSL